MTERLGDFEIVREIGRGGMGVVYEARQVSLKRRVALKVLPPGLGLASSAVSRFEREAQAAARLHHTNIVPVFAIGEDRGSHFYAMELIDGQPLSRVIEDLKDRRSNPFLEETVTRTAEARPPQPEQPGSSAPSSPKSLTDSDTSSREWFDTVARLLAEVAEALEYAHGNGIIHRDIKPSNLMLARGGRLCLTDFGLARVAEEPRMTVTGSFLGTPAYMSPEQIAAGRVKVDHRTDVYSLGAVMYEFLTLERSFSGETREKVLAAIMAKEPRAPRRINPRIPLDLETICLKAIEKDPDRRYRTAAEMAGDLRQYLQRGLITARRAGPVRRAAKWARRHPVTATGVAAVVLVAILVGVAWQYREARRLEAVEHAIADARYFEKSGKWRKALERIEAALDLDPGNREARSFRAYYNLFLDHTVAAAQDAEAVLKEDPTDWRSHVVLANVAVNPWYGVQTVPAEEHLEAVERLAPHASDALTARATIARGKYDPQNAMVLLEQALDLDPGNVLALLGHGWANVDMGRFDAALADAGRLRVTAPSWGHQMEARIHHGRGDFQAALSAIERALKIDPEDADFHRTRSMIYASMGRNSESVVDATRAIELDPAGYRFYMNRSDLLRSLSRFDEAIADARRAVEMNPDAVGGYAMLLIALADAQRWDDHDAAIEQLERRIERWPNESGRIAAEQWMIRTTLDPSKAVERVDKAIKRGTVDTWMYSTRAEALSYLSPVDCDRILADMRKAESLAAGDPAAADDVAQVYAQGVFPVCPQRYEQDRTLEFAKRAVEGLPGDFASLNTLGLVLYRGARYREASDALNKALALEGAEPLAGTLFALAMTGRKLGQKAEAQAAYDRAIQRMQQTRRNDPTIARLKEEASQVLRTGQ